MILLAPILIPIGTLSNHRGRRRLMDAARTGLCPDCGAGLGATALDRADAEWAEHMAQLRRENPLVRFRVVRDLDAICPSCGACLKFDKAGRAWRSL
jgi:hypothetical protein